MMILDTDHLAALDRGGPIGRALGERLKAEPTRPAATVVSFEEQLRGWLALVRREADPFKLVRHYSRLEARIQFFSEWTVLSWSDAAAAINVNLKTQRIRISTMDLRIACIVLANDATLLSANLRDFQKVPGLQVQNWLQA